MLITSKAQVTGQMVADQMVAAFEGGSTYWLTAASPSFETRKKAGAESPWYAEGKVYEGEFLITFKSDEGEHRMNAEILKKGLEVMAEKYPDHFKNLVEENGDADTADVFIQCVLFGQIVFG